MPDNLDNLKKVVKYFGSQSKLADEVGVSKMLVSMWINGKSNISLECAMKIENLTGGLFKYSKLIDNKKKSYLRKK